MAENYSIPERYRHIKPMTTEGADFLRSYFDEELKGWPEVAQKIGASRTGEGPIPKAYGNFPLYGDDTEKDRFLLELLMMYGKPQNNDSFTYPVQSPTPVPTQPPAIAPIGPGRDINDPGLFGT